MRRKDYLCAKNPSLKIRQSKLRFGSVLANDLRVRKTMTRRGNTFVVHTLFASRLPREDSQILWYDRIY